MQTSKVMMGMSFLNRKSASLGSLCPLHCSVLRTIALGLGLEGENIHIKERRSSGKIKCKMT